MKKNLKINELLGSEGKPIGLRDLDSELAKSAAAPKSGLKDNNPNDDKAKVNFDGKVKVGTLKPAQKEVIPMKALAFALGFLDNGSPNLKEMEAIVSQDGYIMDGHHRWAAATLVNPEMEVQVAKIEMNAVDLITALNVYTKGALQTEGNQGAGDISDWNNLIVEEIKKAYENGFSEENGNAILPGNKAKPNWPMFSNGKGKTKDEVQALFAKVPGADGDAKKGAEKMIENSKKLITQRLPDAPERIDMPVIDAGLTPNGEETDDVKKSQLYDVCKRIANGTLDISKPYTKEVSSKLKESRIIKTFEKFKLRRK